MLAWLPVKHALEGSSMLSGCWLLCFYLQLPNTRRLVEIRNNVLRFPLMPPGPLQTDCDEG
jgi:hypothetical protein